MIPANKERWSTRGKLIKKNGTVLNVLITGSGTERGAQAPDAPPRREEGKRAREAGLGSRMEKKKAPLWTKGGVKKREKTWEQFQAPSGPSVIREEKQQRRGKGDLIDTNERETRSKESQKWNCGRVRAGKCRSRKKKKEN